MMAGRVETTGEDSEFVTPKEAAKLLGIDRSSLYIALAEGGIPAVRVGNYWRISKEVIDEMRQRGREYGAPTIDEAMLIGEMNVFAERVGLTERQKYVLFWRLGPSSLTLKEIAERFTQVGATYKPTSERIRQMESTALRKVRSCFFTGAITVRDIPPSLPTLCRMLLFLAMERMKDENDHRR